MHVQHRIYGHVHNGEWCTPSTLKGRLPHPTHDPDEMMLSMLMNNDNNVVGGQQMGFNGRRGSNACFDDPSLSPAMSYGIRNSSSSSHSDGSSSSSGEYAYGAGQGAITAARMNRRSFLLERDPAAGSLSPSTASEISFICPLTLSIPIHLTGELEIALQIVKHFIIFVWCFIPSWLKQSHGHL